MKRKYIATLAAALAVSLLVPLAASAETAEAEKETSGAPDKSGAGKAE